MAVLLASVPYCKLGGRRRRKCWNFDDALPLQTCVFGIEIRKIHWRILAVDFVQEAEDLGKVKYYKNSSRLVWKHCDSCKQLQDSCSSISGSSKSFIACSRLLNTTGLAWDYFRTEWNFIRPIQIRFRDSASPRLRSYFRKALSKLFQIIWDSFRIVLKFI